MPNVRRVASRVAPLVALPLLATMLGGCGTTSRSAAAGWHLGWRAETVFPAVSTTTTTCRFVARLSGTGSRVRVELTDDAFGRGYTLEAGYVSTPTSLSSLDVQANSSRQLHFGGRTSVRVNPGATVLSDPLPFPVKANTGVSLTITAAAGDAWSKGIQVEPGACTTGAPAAAGAAPGRTFHTTASPRWVRSVLVDGPAQRSIVAFGDSITEGPPGPYVRWSDQLSGAGLTTVNAGVGGNAISVHGLFGSAPGIDRARLVMNEPNVTDLVMLMGTNDLGFGVSGAQVLSSLDQVIGEARLRGIAVYVGTILPRTGFGWSAANEAQRTYVNNALRGTWLRSRGGVLVDSDAVMRDPAVHTRLLPAYNSGDGLHPNALGAARLGRAFLAVVSPVTPPPPTTSPRPTVTPTGPAPSGTPAPTTTPTTPAPTTPAPTGSPSVEPSPSLQPTDTPTGTPSTEPVPSGEPAPSTTQPSDPSGNLRVAPLPTLDLGAAELAPRTAGYLKVRASSPGLAEWTW